MTKQKILSLLPYFLIYILIFKDPYQYIIPVKEPILTYSAQTTWLLDESNKSTNFAIAYNQNFKPQLTDPQNAFPYFIKAFADSNFDSSTNKILQEFIPLGENLESIELNKDKSNHNLIFKNLINKIPIDNFFNDPILLKNKLKIFEIIEKINIPTNINKFEVPCFTNINDASTILNKAMQYTLHLALYADNLEKAKKALWQCRLLANQSDPKQLLNSILVYNLIIKNNNIQPEILNEIEQNIPEWPNFNLHFSQLFRAMIISEILTSTQEINNEIQSYSKDFFFDKTVFLNQFNDFRLEIEKRDFNKPINKLTAKNKIELMNIEKKLKEDPDKRSLADIAMFSGSIKDRHKRMSIQIANNVIGLYLDLFIQAIFQFEREPQLLKEIKYERPR